ncbi:MAG: GlsB/YeaQ/YmgE family stress response membrane protein [Bacteroidota bacterium]
MGILSWIVFGLIAGALAKFVMPGRDPGGLIMTTLIGIAGAMVGGFIGTFLGFGSVTGFNLGSFGIAIGGALVLLFLYRRMKGSKQKARR